jgi:2-methylcitrate dehydratase
MTATEITLPRDSNQALGLAQYAHDFLCGKLGAPGELALRAVERFHLDSVACAVSALALGANAPNVLRSEALEYAVTPGAAGARCFGSRTRVHAEKAIAANSSAAREWDSNGTNFGYNPRLGHMAGEFGHNDFYPVVIAAAEQRPIDGDRAALAMLLLDEIRGRLAEVFSLKEHKIDHVVHGAIASAVVYGALLGATAEQIESSVGMVVAHYIPFRAIRAGKQLSDSKGASAALSTEMAVVSVRRAMRGFVGPADIFRNPEAIFCLYGRPAKKAESPFDLTLTTAGDDFAVCGMHFKLGLYEHQSAGAIQGVIDLLTRHPQLLRDESQLKKVRIKIYEPAFGIIGDPAKRDPRTRQSADHSMVYIIATLLRKAFTLRVAGWKELMLAPADYDDQALFDPLTRSLMERIEFAHGGPEYDAKYPDGIPTSLEFDHEELGSLSSGLVMYPAGHARYQGDDLESLLSHKFQLLAGLGVADPAALYERCHRLRGETAEEMAELYAFEIRGLEIS